MAARTTLLFIALVAALAVAAVAAQDPTSYITAYPPRTGCKDSSPYNLTMQAWQIEPCTYVIKYSIYGRPGISDFGFSLSPNAGRTITVSGCSSDSWSPSGGNGNTCTTNGPYGGWTADGSMVKIDETQGCDQQATFYIKATLTTLITTGSTLALKGATNCWTCTDAPYGFGAATSCPSASPTRTPSPSASPVVSPSRSATPSVSVSPSRSATPSVSASPSSAVSPSSSATPSPVVSPSRSATPSVSVSPSSAVSPSSSVTPSISASRTPSPSSSVTPTASPSTLVPQISLPPTLPSPSAALSVSPSPPILSQSGGGASSGAIAGGVVGGIAGVGAAGAVLAGAGYLAHRMMNRPPAPAELTSAFDAATDNAGGVNALFVDQAAMQPNPLFAEMP